MDRLLLPLLAALCLLTCSSSSPPAPVTSLRPPAPSVAASPTIVSRPPSDLILADADVGLPRVSARDNVGLNQAAAEQQNQPLALTDYRRWGWVEESTRSWGGGTRKVDESLLLLTRADGATLAFKGWSGELAQGAACSDGLGLDQCAAGSGGLVGRVGRYLFRLSGAGVDFAKLAGVQAARVRRS